MCVIRNDTESRVRRIFLHDPPQRHLGRRRHRIRLVEYDKLVCRN